MSRAPTTMRATHGTPSSWRGGSSLEVWASERSWLRCMWGPQVYRKPPRPFKASLTDTPLADIRSKVPGIELNPPIAPALDEVRKEHMIACSAER